MNAREADSDEFEPDGEERPSRDHDVAALRAAFLAGFITGRTGTYLGQIPETSERAALSKFERYYRNNVE
jgi:hypothetical protein